MLFMEWALTTFMRPGDLQEEDFHPSVLVLHLVYVSQVALKVPATLVVVQHIFTAGLVGNHPHWPFIPPIKGMRTDSFKAEGFALIASLASLACKSFQSLLCFGHDYTGFVGFPVRATAREPERGFCSQYKSTRCSVEGSTVPLWAGQAWASHRKNHVNNPRGRSARPCIR